MDLSKMLFTVKADEHTPEAITKILQEHKEVQFVSMVGIDIGGHDTDEKIPVGLFIEDVEKFLKNGVQTDGSSVVLPKIASLNNAKVDIIPDLDVNWFVDYNLTHEDPVTGLPVGTLRIPCYLVHNDTNDVGSRIILKKAVDQLKAGVLRLIKENPYVLEYMDIDSADDIEEILLTAATELEFWVKTPDDDADREQLTTSQVLKEQYWQRTVGPVRTALEKSLCILDQYGFEMEMGHKEVGGVKAKLGNSGAYDHIMEQLEIDWKFSSAMQAADNEKQIKYIIRDVFRTFGLEVTFMAKPIEGVAGNGEHTHMGISARLKNGKVVNLFAPTDLRKEFMNPIGFGALMGILKNYEVINPFVAPTNDSLNRLKPGFEAPVCIVTSLGHEPALPSRNRTVLIGLIRDMTSKLGTRFELRAPCPKCNTYLVLAACYTAMLDGIQAALTAGKTPSDLEAAISKKYGEEAFYLEKDRVYRSEEDVFEDFTAEERDQFFGKAPATVWENVSSFEKYPEKIEVLKGDGVMSDLDIESYKTAMIEKWATELRDRIIPQNMDIIRECKKLHNGEDSSDLDEKNWQEIMIMRNYLGKDTIREKSLLTRIKEALADGEYETASELQQVMQVKVSELIKAYICYKNNLF